MLCHHTAGRHPCEDGVKECRLFHGFQCFQGKLLGYFFFLFTLQIYTFFPTWQVPGAYFLFSLPCGQKSCKSCKFIPPAAGISAKRSYLQDLQDLAPQGRRPQFASAASRSPPREGAAEQEPIIFSRAFLLIQYFFVSLPFETHIPRQTQCIN